MSFYRTEIMDKLEEKLGLQGEYREDQSGHPWIASRAYRRTENQELDHRWYQTPSVTEDWRRMHWALQTLLEKHPELLDELPTFEGAK